jgi:hypothetical protein
MKHRILLSAAAFLVTALPGFADPTTPVAAASSAVSPDADMRTPSPGHTTYFVSPVAGDDANTGTATEKPWKSFAKINALKLAPGDKVVVAPGVHTSSLTPLAQGTAAEPVVISFLPGVHEFAVETALRRAYFVSNACDSPTTPMPIGILVENCRHLRLTGAGLEGEKKTLLLMGGRMVEAVNDRSENIAYIGLVFDLKRPTVSEFRVLEAQGNTAVIQVAEGSTYEIKDGRFAWTGDLGFGDMWNQTANPATGKCRRWGAPNITGKAEDLGGNKVKFTYDKGVGGMVVGMQHHYRRSRRDSVGVHNAHSRNIAFEDCDFYALTGMGMVSQFTENITLRRVRVAPPKGTIRTCPAWADIFHFSNCKGAVLVEDCVGSGMQDDFVNCHGTHLRILDKPAENELRVRYMHAQTYGFAPYAAGDELAVIDNEKLRELPGNPRRKVTACRKADKSGKVWIVTLDGPAPAFGKDDAVDNTTWHPDLTLRRNKVDMDPVRGFLITTRGKVLAEDNSLQTHMAGILIEDDARGWYESTCIRDMTLRNNRFIGCGIDITPKTTSTDPKEPVHENIRIENNTFDGGDIRAKSVKGLTLSGNKTASGDKVVTHIESSCSEVKAD